MNFKLIMAVVESRKTRKLLKAAREAGASGSTVIANVRGEGATRSFGILGLEVTDVRDVLLFLVHADQAQTILHTLAEVGEFDQKSGTGIAIQLDVEQALGIQWDMRQIR
ncbi:MAG: P-II family nitrogen regulator [Wenzhouxiangella sp.]